jgi:hypothetical protein
MAACSGSEAWPLLLGALVQGSATPCGPDDGAHGARQAAAYLRPWGLAARQPRWEPRSPEPGRPAGRSRSGAHAPEARHCRPPQPHQSRCLGLELDCDKLARRTGEQARERRRVRGLVPRTGRSRRVDPVPSRPPSLTSHKLTRNDVRADARHMLRCHATALTQGRPAARNKNAQAAGRPAAGRKRR